MLLTKRPRFTTVRRLAVLFAICVVSSGLARQQGFTAIDVPGATSTFATGINPRGDIVGGYGDASGGHGFLLSNGTFTTIDVPGAISTFARGINSRGDIVGTYRDASGGHGFLLSNGTFTTIDVPGASFTQPAGINARGDIVGDSSSHSFLLTK
jgi:uncharacterized membrane protein